MSLRPKRIRVINEIGQPRSLPSGATAFEKLGRGAECIFLGLGPEPGKLPTYFPEVKSARYVECSAFVQQMDAAWTKAVPSSFTPMQPEELTPELIRRSTIFRYTENSRIFPGFWGPLRARCALSHLADAPLPEERIVWLPGGENDLLARELEVAFQVEGLRVERVNPEHDERPDNVPWMLTKLRPKLFFSVNFKGLDSYGGYYHLLKQAGARVAVWCVDNPFHLLTGIKSNYWKELDLFVTDSWFIEPLKKLGAQSVHHLPLATSPGLFKTCGKPGAFSDLSGRLVFVGRSEFPQKSEFFSGLKVDPKAWAEALKQLTQSKRVDFGWWATRLGVQKLWPGNEVRVAGLGAEEIGKAWRTICLSGGIEKLTVFGDALWKQTLPQGTDVRGTVDYYTELPDVYRNAACVLNMTSPLLPSGLTQRHFDVWAAGGMLITDTTPGLAIFPQELVQEVTFGNPSEIAGLFERFRSAGAGAAVSAAWKECILSSHTYRHRIRFLLDRLGL